MQRSRNLPYVTIYVQIFKVSNFQGFCGHLAMGKIFILKILLPKLLHASIGEKDTREKLCLTLARNDGML